MNRKDSRPVTESMDEIGGKYTITQKIEYCSHELHKLHDLWFVRFVQIRVIRG